MPNIAVVDMTGKSVGELTLSDAVFGIAPNAVVMHAAVVNYLANQRQGTQSTLTRTEVSGGGKKPWRQKGTGHARQGSTRAPQWRHGGIVHAPKPRDYAYSLNKKVRKLALKSALSDKALGGNIIVLDEFKMDIRTEAWLLGCARLSPASTMVWFRGCTTGKTPGFMSPMPPASGLVCPYAFLPLLKSPLSTSYPKTEI